MGQKKVVRRRSSAVSASKIIVSWNDAEFAFANTEIESAMLFALRYAIRMKRPVHLRYLGYKLTLDGVILSGLPKHIPMWQDNLPLKPTKQHRKVKIKRKT